jgi:hypothetical protein
MATRFGTVALSALITAAMAAPAQVLDNGIFHSPTGVQFTLPPDWVIVSQGRGSASTETVILRNVISNVIARVWMKARSVNPADIPALMDTRLDSKAAQRNNFEGYTYRPDSVQKTTIGGQPALSAVADYVRTGQRMVEYLTWVDGEKSRVLFVARIPASDLADFHVRFDSVIQSVVVP